MTQLASRVDSAMHAETSNGDDPFAEVKGLISDMIARLEEKASEDLYLMISMISLVSRNAESNTNQLQGDIESVQDRFRRVIVAADKRRVRVSTRDSW